MATTAQQATYAAQQGKNWAAPGEAGFGTAGYIGQPEYDQYLQANPGQGNLGGDVIAHPVGGSPNPQTAGQAVTSQGTIGNVPAQGSQSNVAGAFQQALLNKLAPAPVTAQNANIAPAIQANTLAAQRGQERSRATLAEQAAAQGTNMSGGMDSRLLGLDQARAQNEGAFNANAILGESDKQRQESQQASAIVASLLGQQDALNMQKYGIDTGADTARLGINTQGALGQGDLALRDKLGSGGLNLGLLQALLSNQQFGQNLGAQTGMFTAGLNQDALMKMLGLV